MIMMSSIISELLIFVFDLFGSVSEQVAQGSYHSVSTFTGTIDRITRLLAEDSSIPAFRVTGSGDDGVFDFMLDQEEVVCMMSECMLVVSISVEVDGVLTKDLSTEASDGGFFKLSRHSSCTCVRCEYDFGDKGL